MSIHRDPLDVEHMLGRLAAALQPAQADPVVARVAMWAFGEVKKRTPKRWTGQVRNAWQIQKNQDAEWRLWNDNKIMRWLEEGTGQSSGGFIYPRFARALFVALTKRAAMSVAQNRTAFGMGGMTTRRTRVARSGRAELVYGVDYVLAKRVRGIAPMRIVAKLKDEVRERMLDAMKAHLRAAMKAA